MMFDEGCENLEYLPLYYSWKRDCGGSWWELTSRTITITDSLVLFILGLGTYARGGFLLKGAGTGMLAKSANDIYEASTGRRGIVRDNVGDIAYDIFSYAVMGYGLFRKVPKINYLGNPKRDFFVRDPLTYESAFMQYSGIELTQTIIGASISLEDDLDKYKDVLSIEVDWQVHLFRTNITND